MWFRLARALGGRTVGEWQAAMTLDELRLWSLLSGAEKLLRKGK